MRGFLRRKRILVRTRNNDCIINLSEKRKGKPKILKLDDKKNEP